MNIFILDKEIAKCAKYHCDKHVVKMILEYAQILSTVCHSTGTKTKYKPTHTHHPCVIWAGKSRDNWLWLKRLARALNKEYRYRYHKTQDHHAYSVIKLLKTPNLPRIGLTPFVQAMPEKYQTPRNPVKAYREYYIGMKSGIATWTRRQPPAWYLQSL